MVHQKQDAFKIINLKTLLTCEQFPGSKLLSLEDQQHCSWFNQNACGQIPNLRSVIQLAPMSITPATVPVTSPTNNTHNQPDQASCAPSIKFQMESCFFLTIYRWCIRSLAMSLCQSIVWKSSYCPMPGISADSEIKNTMYIIRLVENTLEKKLQQNFNWNWSSTDILISQNLPWYWTKAISWQYQHNTYTKQEAKRIDRFYPIVIVSVKLILLKCNV